VHLTWRSAHVDENSRQTLVTVCLPRFLVCTLSKRYGLLYEYEAVFSIEKYLFMPRQAVEYGPCFDGKSLRYPADDTASNCGPGVRPGHRRRSHRASSLPISSVPPPPPSLWSWDILGSPLPTPLAHHGKSCFSRMCSLSRRAAKPFFCAMGIAASWLVVRPCGTTGQRVASCAVVLGTSWGPAEGLHVCARWHCSTPTWSLESVVAVLVIDGLCGCYQRHSSDLRPVRPPVLLALVALRCTAVCSGVGLVRVLMLLVLRPPCLSRLV